MCELIGEEYLEITMFPNSVRITNGWFFPENSDGENAIYWDYYFGKDGRMMLVLDEGNNMLEFATFDIEFGEK